MQNTVCVVIVLTGIFQCIMSQISGWSWDLMTQPQAHEFCASHAGEHGEVSRCTVEQEKELEKYWRDRSTTIPPSTTTGVLGRGNILSE